MIRVLICDDQEIVCEGLATILSPDDEIEVVGTAYNGAEAIELIPSLLPDIILMDLKMPVMNGILATQNISRRYPEIRILVLTTYEDDEWLFDAIRSGASGYLLKDTPRVDLIDAIKGTIAGDSFVDPALTGKLLARIARTPRPDPIPSTIDLTSRENEILASIARGLSNAEIAEQLFLSEGTIRNYTSALFQKLGVSDRTQAVVTALRYGLINLQDS